MKPTRYTSYTIQVDDGVTRARRFGTVQITAQYLAYRKNSLTAIAIAMPEGASELTGGAIASANANGVEVIPRGEILRVEKKQLDGEAAVQIQAQNRNLLTFFCADGEEVETVFQALKG